ncbi:hypothetical protein KUH03_07740 [Sphingobacterium sp. E70]|uniref:hypothetical protein n=1 Tax=Sphingobacterium sp. E70 TaxID=2853439 RepID=UPI00211BD4A2|nr:hypothetical protein [Sphingobacterium sp. E70]ULT26716.1 hypothetical protein KUH03_07740 [Sphingobacterium sp. E70]
MKHKILTSPLFAVIALSFVFCVASCTKTEYRTVEDPAYIRVFNNLTYTLTLDNKEEAQPFFCMFIDPEFDASGKPIDGLAIGDFWINGIFMPHPMRHMPD